MKNLVQNPVSDGSGAVLVEGRAYRAAVTFQRPSNTTAYTAGDVIGIADSGTPANPGSAIHTLASVGAAGGYVLVQSVELLIVSPTVPSGMAAFRLHLYTASPTAILDNASFDLASGDAASYVGYIDISTPQDMGSSLYSQTDYPGRLIELASGSSSLFAVLETRGGYTPSSGTSYSLRAKTLDVGV